jgi:acyl-CoA reductase-like NAD-dependent aldehyde dehydrogenase
VTDARPILVGGVWESSGDELLAHAAGTGEILGSTFHATAEQLDRATSAAVAAFEVTKRMPSYERAAILQRVADGMLARKDEIARSLAQEIGKPLGDALIETERTAFLFHYAAGEAERLGGELLPLDLVASSTGKWAITRRVPIGPVAGISPFNVPLSLSAHKLAPAIAVGNTIVLKPDSRVALTLLKLAEILVDAGVPEGAVSMLPMAVDVADAMVTDDRFKLLSFTGSARVGWDMKARAGRKQVVLELGGNAAAIVAEDADLDVVMKRLVQGAFKYAGQICISTQRVLVHSSLADELRARLVAGAESQLVGDALDDGVDLGPMISEEAAEKTVALVVEAVADGATLLTGGSRTGAYMQPTLLEGVPAGSRLAREEAFAPVATFDVFEDLAEAIAKVNDSDFGLQAGVFTRDLRTIWAAFEGLDVGGVIINDIPGYRIDHMPYGGVKDSGLGREGVKYAIEHMTELRTLVITPGS